jgi:hypothetical protein
LANLNDKEEKVVKKVFFKKKIRPEANIEENIQTTENGIKIIVPTKLN